MQIQKRQKSSAYNADDMLKRNAAFLIEASKKIDYDLGTLHQMKEAFSRAEYNDVIDLAYIHDRAKRAHKRCCQKDSASDYANEVISELSPKPRSENTPLECCVSAVHLLCKDLTYDNRELAKTEIRKAIHVLNEA